jgi:hypothetical protein
VNRVSKWLMKRAMMQVSFEAAKLLCIVGGLVVLISGVYFFALSRIALGLVATVISGQVKHLVWNGIIVVVGAVAYYLFPGGGGLWNYGALLVIAAGIIGAITHII